MTSEGSMSECPAEERAEDHGCPVPDSGEVEPAVGPPKGQQSIRGGGEMDEADLVLAEDPGPGPGCRGRVFHCSCKRAAALPFSPEGVVREGKGALAAALSVEISISVPATSAFVLILD
ncbi:hypothetical protein JZ751_026857 [Albula glossodonta]|uniref:Uncharacterized protein n=1 Tax=Albula glossodonta TaxID=121402 RepID=A0A8T2PH43_9TELE|nr:hypothetical protein JZ751_026857 [Albula glossodonta]